MYYLKTITLLWMIPLVVSCGKKEVAYKQENSASKTVVPSFNEFQYELKEANCTTGNQKFDSKPAYCYGLLNDTLNSNCARNERFEKFKTECSQLNLVIPNQLNPSHESQGPQNSNRDPDDTGIEASLSLDIEEPFDQACSSTCYNPEEVSFRCASFTLKLWNGSEPIDDYGHSRLEGPFHKGILQKLRILYKDLDRYRHQEKILGISKTECTVRYSRRGSYEIAQGDKVLVWPICYKEQANRVLKDLIDHKLCR